MGAALASYAPSVGFSGDGVVVRWLPRALIALALLVAFLGMLTMNVRLDQQARDLDRAMPCSSDNDAACRSGLVR